MKRALISIAAVTLLAAARAPSGSDVDYGFTASIEGDRLSVRHRVLNRSGRALCFFPDMLDMDKARIGSAEGKTLNSIHNAGFISGRQTVYFAANDGMPHLFSYSADLNSVLSPAESARAQKLEFDFYGFDCNALTSGRAGLKPIVRKAARAVISRAPRP